MTTEIKRGRDVKHAFAERWRCDQCHMPTI